MSREQTLACAVPYASPSCSAPARLRQTDMDCDVQNLASRPSITQLEPSCPPACISAAADCKEKSERDTPSHSSDP